MDNDTASSVVLSCTTSAPDLPWIQQPLSAFAFISFAVAVIGLAAIKYILFAVIDRASLCSRSPSRTVFARVVSVFRFLIYRKPWFLYGCPPAAALLILVFTVFSFAWVFSIRPFYGGQTPANGSPLLAVRAGWFALATTPFLFALATKKNFISLTTGISYEQLNVYHRLITVVHAFPFFIRAYEQQSLGREWNANKAWWTGIVSFFVLVWIFISSLIPIRRLSYEFFVFQHIVSAIAYLVFIFLHTRDLFTSWIYLWATIALYGGSILIRTLISVWWTLVTTEAEVTTLVDDAVSVQIPVPTTKGQWKAGQHVFVRFPAIAPFQSHPFTIASIEENAELTLIIQKHNGFTKKLYDTAKEKGPWKTRVVIDGPYGGPPRDPGSFDTVVLVAGGAGVTFTMPIMKDLVRRMQDLGKLRCSKLIFIWSVKKESTLEWLEEEIDQCTMGAEDIVQAKLYVTRSNKYEKDMPMLVSNATIDYMRPPLRKLLERAVEENRGRMCVLGAGPESMTSNLSTEVAVLQKRVMDGRSGEIFLHVESFG